MDHLDSQIIDRLKSGDRSAFNSLLQTYRETAIGWAKDITRDEYLAEDIVQEAFLKLQVKIGQLQDPQKFRPWFRQMVRRMAMNHLRGTSRMPSDDFIQERSTQQGGTSPIQYILEKEKEDEILSHTMSSLSTQAQSIMKDIALGGYTAEELAVRYNMPKSNVYNIISRSRVKAKDERFRHEIKRYIQERKGMGLANACMLRQPAIGRPYSLLAVMIYEVLKYADTQTWSLTDIMGISGEAFRLNVADGCQWQGISTFDWSYSTYLTMERLGLSVKCFGRPGRPVLLPEHQVNALKLMQQSIDRGYPAIVWNLVRNEFGLVYGYDDRTQIILYQGFSQAPESFAYNRLGRSEEEPALFVASIGVPVAAPSSDSAVIAAIVDHARGKEPAISGFSFGLDGYRRWQEAVKNGNLDPLGHAYQVAILVEARLHAVQFLQQMVDRTKDSYSRESLSNALFCYKKVAKSLRSLYPSFPFGYGGSLAGSNQFEEGLFLTMKAEEEGILHLEQIVSHRK